MTEPTNEEIDALVAAYLGDCGPQATRVYSFARAVLAKWGTPPAVVVEPVAYRHMHDDGWEYYDAPTGSDCPGCEPLYTAPQPTQAQAGAVPLTDERILELAGLAPDRKVCASTCMAAKFEKKPCECYPTSASRSEVVVIARAIEAAHGIKGGQHGNSTT